MVLLVSFYYVGDYVEFIKYKFNLHFINVYYSSYVIIVLRDILINIEYMIQNPYLTLYK